VQNRLIEQKEAFLRLWDDGANLFVCGGREMRRAVEVACIEILRESNGMTKEEGQKLLNESRNKRVFIDSFS
jgi:cytochrome P450/NADPH-cytochrome P450 reductase